MHACSLLHKKGAVECRLHDEAKNECALSRNDCIKKFKSLK